MSSLIDRHNAILEKLSKFKKIQVDELANHFHVSVVTIRKDLSLLETQGLLKRTQGYAIINEKNDLHRRLASNHRIKRLIAKKAAQLVTDGETIMVESGSCCILLADELCKAKKNLTIITNSIFLATYIDKYSHVKIVLLGGDFQPDSQALVGPITSLCASTFHIDKFFVGTDGYVTKKGFTGDNHLRVETLRNMSKSANQIILMTESKKFTHQGVVPLFGFSEIKHVITDNGLRLDLLRELRSKGLTVTLV